ncbi:MAG: hypothetical protein Hens2KO_13430 [Henriciella sp.]
MLSLLVAVRNYTIAILLAWMGFSVSPDSDDKKEANSASPTAAIASVLTR